MAANRITKFLMRALRGLPLVLCLVLSAQGAALSVHQGLHAGEAVHHQIPGPSLISVGSCAYCASLKAPVKTTPIELGPNRSVAVISRVIEREPVDPLSTVRRTCDARGPPLFPEISSSST